MSARILTIGVAVLAALGLAAGLVFVGRATVDTGAARNRGYQAGLDAGYINGLPAGEAEGRQEGRALQEGDAVPAGDQHAVRDAFNDGYAAGANDAFAGYDGGWSRSTPYVVTIRLGAGQITYRIASREPVQAGTDYYLCPDGHSLCQQPRP
jgi:hypothetical protein